MFQILTCFWHRTNQYNHSLLFFAGNNHSFIRSINIEWLLWSGHCAKSTLVFVTGAFWKCNAPFIRVTLIVEAFGTLASRLFGPSQLSLTQWHWLCLSEWLVLLAPFLKKKKKEFDFSFTVEERKQMACLGLEEFFFSFQCSRYRFSHGKMNTFNPTDCIFSFKRVVSVVGFWHHC